MLLKLIINLLITYSYVNCRIFLVSNSRQLRESIRIVSPGDTIQLRDGYYSGGIITSQFGLPTAPIRLIGSQRAIISNNRGTGILMTGQYWWLRGFTVRNCRKGIIMNNAKNNLLDRLIVRDTDEEGIVIRIDSTANTIRNCYITRTGRLNSDNGFGISIGSDERSSFRGYVDRSDRNTIQANRLQTGSPAEAIYIYEGTCCGNIIQNYFDGRPLTTISNNNNNKVNDLSNNNLCWVAINGNRYRVERNVGRNTAFDGFRVRLSQSYDNNGYSDYGQNSNFQRSTETYSQTSRGGGDTGGYNSRRIDNNDYGNDDNNDIEIQGCNNVFRANSCILNTNGVCIRVINPGFCRTYIYSDNRVSGNSLVTNVGVITALNL